MALATQCPHCHTTFRVAQDQLKLRAGLVRCGACKEIFNGIEHLLPPDLPAAPANPPPPDEASSETTASVAASEAPPSPEGKAAEPKAAAQEAERVEVDEAAKSAKPDAPADFFDFFEFLKPAESAAKPPASDSGKASDPPAEPATDDPLQRMTLIDFTERPQETDEDTKHHIASDEAAPESPPPNETEAGKPDAIDKAIDDLQHKPRRRPRNMRVEENEDEPDIDTEVPDEPSFVIRGRRKQKVGRVVGILFVLGTVTLTLALLAQGAYAFRSKLAAYVPKAKPVLEKVCSFIGCRVDLPAQIDVVSIESSDLQTLASNNETLVLTALLRNHGSIVQAWPHIELTLNDANEKPLVRRVFLPREYLPALQDVAKGFAATSEQPVKLAFELAQLKPAGYRVYLFYP